MAKRKLMVGLKFGTLSVVSFDSLDKRKQACWLCFCDCGEHIVVNGNALRSGKVTSCGCNRGKRVDLLGQRFDRLEVIKFDKVNHDRAAHWWCRCDCGKVVSVRSNGLRSGQTKSCGCLKAENLTYPTPRIVKHGHASRGKTTKEYKAWINMMTRCRDKNTPYFKNYGGRGISVCERWQTFENFFADMGQSPQANLSIDRINNDGNYEPGNCRWATRSEQNRNQRRSTS